MMITDLWVRFLCWQLTFMNFYHRNPTSCCTLGGCGKLFIGRGWSTNCSAQNDVNLSGWQLDLETIVSMQIIPQPAVPEDPRLDYDISKYLWKRKNAHNFF